MENIHFLYILKSSALPRHYIGISSNPSRRLSQHNAGEVRSTKGYRPWKLEYVQMFVNKKEARLRELFLKKTARARKDLFDSIDRTALSSNG
ncbi:GIY-YIG nuclease family protein [Candidatus Kaiserbacteria bacterium]|nr:GIY-YIG nuclease family protein [Candidatus Kaiserbacteria bacterium]